MPILLVAVAVMLMLGAASCAQVKAASPEAIRPRVEALEQNPSVAGERLLQPAAIRRFYEERKFQPAWTRSRAEKLVEEIQEVGRDGLRPADYHTEAIGALLEQESPSPEALADLDLLLTDAIAGAVDHVRYGRVRPVALDPRWNVNPREDAPPLEQTLAELARAGWPDDAIERARPDHFIYRGLLDAYAKLREIEADGGWPRVPPGKAIKPGATNPRVARVRARLAVTGEIDAGAGPDSSRYDNRLVEAVKRFQQRHRLEPDGLIDKATVEAMNVPAATRAAQVRVNLERARWVVSGLSDEFLLVNLPAFKAYLIQGGSNQWETRTQIGQEARQTPSFRATMKTVVFNPDWTVPPTILEEDVLEGMRKGVDMIAKKKLTILDAEGQVVSPSSIDWNSVTPETFPYTLRQPPGEDNALGRVKFLFPNKHSIYLHDTPSRELFAAEKRTFSSGCIRVERPLELAERLLRPQGWNSRRIEQALANEKTQHINLEHSVPVLIVYWTVSVGASGEVRYMQDIYNLDRRVLAALDSRARPTATGAGVR